MLARPDLSTRHTGTNDTSQCDEWPALLLAEKRGSRVKVFRSVLVCRGKRD